MLAHDFRSVKQRLRVLLQHCPGNPLNEIWGSILAFWQDSVEQVKPIVVNHTGRHPESPELTQNEPRPRSFFPGEAFLVRVRVRANVRYRHFRRGDRQRDGKRRG